MENCSSDSNLFFLANLLFNISVKKLNNKIVVAQCDKKSKIREDNVKLSFDKNRKLETSN